MAERSSTPVNGDKPVIVRVKRKAFDSTLDAFWLEIHERPSKRPLLDFGKLSLSDSSSSRGEELKTKKILVWHVETVISSEDTCSVLRSFVPNSPDSSKSKEKAGEGRHNIKTVHKQDLLLAKAKQKQEVLSRTYRFEQIWRCRKGRKEVPEDDAVYEACRVYDVVQIDGGEHEVEMQEDSGPDDCRMMAQYLPLLEEVLPSAAREVEEEIHDYMLKQASDGYVYDLYALEEEDANTVQTDSKIQIPLIHYYDGSDYETDNSNEEIFENGTVDEYEVMSASLVDEKSKGESESSSSSEPRWQVPYESEEDPGPGLCEWSDYQEQWFEPDEEQYW